MGNYKPQKGDRVRVVLEGEVFNCEHDGFDIGTPEHTNFVFHNAGHLASVEKIEPPVEVFKPGDVVRYKHNTKATFTITHEGYVDHEEGVHVDASREQFNSKHYEKIDLG